MYGRGFVPVIIASVFAASAAFADFKQITTEAGYLSAFVGKTMLDSQGHTYSATADGKFAGKLKDGTKVRGAWQWSGKYWCRNAIVGKREIGTDCQKVEVDGNQYRVTRDKGRGGVVTGTLK